MFYIHISTDLHVKFGWHYRCHGNGTSRISFIWW